MSGWPRVLVIDDDPITLRICEAKLRAQAVEVVTVLSGAEACTLPRPDFDLVVVDIHMPHMNGWDTILALRARQDLAGVEPSRFVVLTTDDTPDARARSRAFGVEAHLIKPAGVDRLGPLVRSTHGRDAIGEHEADFAQLHRDLDAAVAVWVSVRTARVRFQASLAHERGVPVVPGDRQAEADQLARYEQQAWDALIAARRRCRKEPGPG